MAGPRYDHDWIATFLDAQAAELGAARNTLLAYGRDLRDAAEWLAGRGSGFAGADRATIEDYLVHCDAQGLAQATRARRLSALKQLYRFAFEEGWREDNPAIQIRGPGRARKLPQTLDMAEVERLLAAARDSGRSPAERLRNICLMELLYATGMRVSELVSLPVQAARGDPRMLLVAGKGGKERLVPLRRRRAPRWPPGWRRATPPRKRPAPGAARRRGFSFPRAGLRAISPGIASTC